MIYLLSSVIILIGIAIVLYTCEPSLYFSPLIAAIMWIVYILFNYIINHDYRIFSTGALFIGFAVSVFSLGSICGYIISKKYLWRVDSFTDSKLIRVISGWHYLAIISIILTLIGLIGLVRYSYQEFQLFNNVYSLLLVPQAFATDRYGGAQFLPIELKLLSYMIYPTALCIGALVGAKFWNPLMRTIPIIFALSYGVIYSSRTVVILTLVSIISAELSVRAINLHNEKIQIKKTLTMAFSFFFGLPLIFIILQWLRQGLSSDLIINDMLQVARSSMTGSFSAFTQWFHHFNVGISYDWGANTFAGPFELLGLSNRVQGFYLDFTEVGETHINIYTVFRGLLQDFGFIGSSIFLFVWGIICSIVFFQVKNGWIIGVPILALMNGWILFTPIISLFVNNSIIGGYFLFFIFSLYNFQPTSILKFQSFDKSNPK
tara:strand:- start:638 stop:1933 length:1296 start_codon:yes stop_codon:yes gene_type:complete